MCVRFFLCISSHLTISYHTMIHPILCYPPIHQTITYNLTIALLGTCVRTHNPCRARSSQQRDKHQGTVWHNTCTCVAELQYLFSRNQRTVLCLPYQPLTPLSVLSVTGCHMILVFSNNMNKTFASSDLCQCSLSFSLWR